jgi:predicted DsbA family dithiol-disulfide isomerase
MIKLARLRVQVSKWDGQSGPGMDEQMNFRTMGLKLRGGSFLQCVLALSIGLLSIGAGKPPGAPADDGELPKNLATEGMTPSERDSLRRLLQKFPSSCGKPHSLLTSLRTDPSCKLSPVAARWMTKLFSDGFLESEVEERFSKRFVDSKCHQIDISGAQVRGDPNAPITIVEFADFECPHCAMTDPVLVSLLGKYKNVKLVFMNYPIPAHANAANAAAAALAAGKQGKFWEYHDLLFKRQDKLRPLDLIMYAEEMKLDRRRFETDMESLRSRVRREREIGEKLELTGTPSLFINCRKFDGTANLENLSSYIEAEMVR